MLFNPLFICHLFLASLSVSSEVPHCPISGTPYFAMSQSVPGSRMKGSEGSIQIPYTSSLPKSAFRSSFLFCGAKAPQRGRGGWGGNSSPSPSPGGPLRYLDQANSASARARTRGVRNGARRLRCSVKTMTWIPLPLTLLGR